MRYRIPINTFSISLPVKNHSIKVVIFSICGDPSHNRKSRFSYSIVGKVSGMTCYTSMADISSDCGRAGKLRDQLDILHNQFIYSNQGNTAAILDISLQLKGMLPGEGMIFARFNIRLHYNLRQIYFMGVKSTYELKPVPADSILLPEGPS